MSQRKRVPFKKDNRAGNNPHPFKKFHKEKPPAQKEDKPFSKFSSERPERKYTSDKKSPFPRFDKPTRAKHVAGKPAENSSDGIRLNKYLSNAGIAARRKADELIKQGFITVNGVVVKEMGHKISRKDIVKYDGKLVKPGKMVYILLNKPKDYITTTDDEKGRRTVLDIIRRVTDERVYPVGRLDRNTTGLLLFTNDGELAQKLSHPSFNTKKVYAAELDKGLAPEDLEKIRKGIKLEEGIAKVDDIQYVDPANKKLIGIEIHIGWNRIVRRIFESLGYEVKKLDRMMFAGLTKKDLPRGRCRHLTEKELVFLKHYL
jgi:23S rRNA pseudouridine2605 synthase